MKVANPVGPDRQGARRAWQTPLAMPNRCPPLPLYPSTVALVALLLLAACGGDAPPGASPAELDRVWRGEGPVIEVRVHDLHCSKCEDAARKAVGALPGVEAVEPDHETDVVRVRLADGTDRYAAIPAIRDALHGIGKDIVGEDEIRESDEAP